MTVYAQHVVSVFTKQSVTASHFIHDSTRSQGGDIGWIDARADDVVVQCRLATRLNAQEFVYRIEGRFDTTYRPASIYCNVLSGVQTSDQLVEISEKVRQLRFALKTNKTVASALASPCIFYGAVCLTERK